jgi:hypothetical protein
LRVFGNSPEFWLNPQRRCDQRNRQACDRRPFPVTFPETHGVLKMSSRAKSPLASHRARRARQGFVRVEVNVRKEDAGLVRQVAAALADPARQAAARLLLRQRFVEPPNVSLKALLVAAPLDGIDLDRGRDLGRDVDL